MRGITLVVAILFLAVPFDASANKLLCPKLPSGAQIRPENQYYEVWPRIVPANQESTVEIVPIHEHAQFKEDCSYELTYAPMIASPQQGGWAAGKKMAVVPENGRIRITTLFEGEQEHAFIIESTCGDKKRTLGDFRVYSVAEDLYGLRPYKGDFHMHSHYSDGVESPAYVAGACRRAGLHFMALTDHRHYASSLQARDAFAGVPVDLRIYPGEEVHSPDNKVHIVNFGGNAGVTELYKDDETAYREQVAALMESLPPTPPAVDRFQFAACRWVIDRIHERNGMAMFAHPYWVTGNRNNVDEALVDYVFEIQMFDAFELISGDDREGILANDINGLQVARYEEERAKGRRIPVCGISDTHGIERSEAFGRYFTLCFAPSPELADLIAAIKDLRSVAVECAGGDMQRAYGPYRLVRYAHFLLREVLPQHDEMCFEEGRLMIQHAAGDPSAAAKLALLQGQTAKLYNRCWTPVATP
ncbi:MAG: DNA polymerase/3'-5' exonuclease PolX [Candidatus Hydrogenedentes bacterium ADurb.Bin101]|nr:MAG: DNA polymerase/3'-5' exonuclease PolX [Candidatus Hydrogenedentes bacterium ADurb.Bin101]